MAFSFLRRHGIGTLFMLTRAMKKLFLFIVMMIAFPTAIQAGLNGLDSESWFGMENRNKIQNLYDQLKEMDETNLGGWDTGRIKND